MRIRATDADGDMTFGQGQRNFYVDQPEAPAQAAKTRLMLFLGEWVLDTRAGTPWNTQVLGKRTADTRDPVIRSRLRGTPGVTALAAYDSRLDRTTREFVVSAELDTAYGRATLETPL